MSLTLLQLNRIAQLARLEPAPDEAERLVAQMNELFALVEQMRAVDCSDVLPLAHPLAAVREVALRLADDVVDEPNQREANQRSAPLVERGLFLVPRVLE